MSRKYKNEWTPDEDLIVSNGFVPHGRTSVETYNRREKLAKLGLCTRKNRREWTTEEINLLMKGEKPENHSFGSCEQKLRKLRNAEAKK